MTKVTLREKVLTVVLLTLALGVGIAVMGTFAPPLFDTHNALTDPYAPEPDRYPAGTTVSLDYMTSSFQLGPKSSQMFLDMLTNIPQHSDFTGLAAAPMGTFRVRGTNYHWHGNAVVRGSEKNVRLWYGPYVQRLINEIMSQQLDDRDTIQDILNRLENDSTVTETQLDPPMAYPIQPDPPVVAQ